nr:MAG TPA: hypothetical protein [Crassvirales sp.]
MVTQQLSRLAGVEVHGTPRAVDSWGFPSSFSGVHRTSCEENESHQELWVVTQGI